MKKRGYVDDELLQPVDKKKLFKIVDGEKVYIQLRGRHPQTPSNDNQQGNPSKPPSNDKHKAGEVIWQTESVPSEESTEEVEGTMQTEPFKDKTEEENERSIRNRGSNFSYSTKWSRYHHLEKKKNRMDHRSHQRNDKLV